MQTEFYDLLSNTKLKHLSLKITLLQVWEVGVTPNPQAAGVQSALTSMELMCLRLVDQLVLTAQIMLLRALPGLLLRSISYCTHACKGDEAGKRPKS